MINLRKYNKPKIPKRMTVSELILSELKCDIAENLNKYTGEIKSREILSDIGNTISNVCAKKYGIESSMVDPFFTKNQIVITVKVIGNVEPITFSIAVE